MESIFAIFNSRLADQEDMDIHDVGAGWSGDNQAIETLEKLIGIIIFNRILQEKGSIFQGSCEGRIVGNGAGCIGGPIRSIRTQARYKARRRHIRQSPHTMQYKLLVISGS